MKIERRNQPHSVKDSIGRKFRVFSYESMMFNRPGLRFTGLRPRYVHTLFHFLPLCNLSVNIYFTLSSLILVNAKSIRILSKYKFIVLV